MSNRNNVYLPNVRTVLSKTELGELTIDVIDVFCTEPGYMYELAEDRIGYNGFCNKHFDKYMQVVCDAAEALGLGYTDPRHKSELLEIATALIAKAMEDILGYDYLERTLLDPEFENFLADRDTSDEICALLDEYTSGRADSIRGSIRTNNYRNGVPPNSRLNHSNYQRSRPVTNYSSPKDAWGNPRNQQLIPIDDLMDPKFKLCEPNHVTHNRYREMIEDGRIPHPQTVNGEVYTIDDYYDRINSQQRGNHYNVNNNNQYRRNNISAGINNHVHGQAQQYRRNSPQGSYNQRTNSYNQYGQNRVNNNYRKQPVRNTASNLLDGDFISRKEGLERSPAAIELPNNTSNYNNVQPAPVNKPVAKPVPNKNDKDYYNDLIITPEQLGIGRSKLSDLEMLTSPEWVAKHPGYGQDIYKDRLEEARREAGILPPQAENKRVNPLAGPTYLGEMRQKMNELTKPPSDGKEPNTINFKGTIAYNIDTPKGRALYAETKLPLPLVSRHIDVWVYRTDEGGIRHTTSPKGKHKVNELLHDASPLLNEWVAQEDERSEEETLDRLKALKQSVRIHELEKDITAMVKEAEKLQVENDGKEVDFEFDSDMIGKMITTNKTVRITDDSILPMVGAKLVKDNLKVRDGVETSKHADVWTSRSLISYNGMKVTPWTMTIDNEDVKRVFKDLRESTSLRSIKVNLMELAEYVEPCYVHELNARATEWLNNKLHRQYGMPVNCMDSFLTDLEELMEIALEDWGHKARDEINNDVKELTEIVLRPRATTEDLIQQVRDDKGVENEYVFVNIDGIVVLPMTSAQLDLYVTSEDGRCVITKDSNIDFYSPLNTLYMTYRKEVSQRVFVTSDNVKFYMDSISRQYEQHLVLTRH